PARRLPLATLQLLLRRPLPALRRSVARYDGRVERAAAPAGWSRAFGDVAVCEVLPVLVPPGVLHRRRRREAAGGARRHKHPGARGGRGLAALGGDLRVPPEEAPRLPVPRHRVPTSGDLADRPPGRRVSHAAARRVRSWAGPRAHPCIYLSC